MVNYTRKKGGKYIAQGTYGCVFGKPPLKCIDEKERSSEDEVSKLMDNYAAKDEMKEGEKWNAIDPTQQFSLTSSKKCEIDVGNIKAENNFNKCSVDYGDEMKDRVLVFYKNGGPDLHKLRPLSANYEKIFSGFQNLFDGLAIAHKNNLVHTDIKPPNILTGNEDIHLRFIDFGLSFDVSDIQYIDEMYTENPTFYPYWPFDIGSFISSGDLKMKWKLKHRYHIFNKKYSADHIGVGISSFNIPFDTLYNIYKEVDFKDLKTIFKKLDVFSMGVTLIEIMRQYFSHCPFQLADGSYYLVYLNGRTGYFSRFTTLKDKKWLSDKQHDYQIYLYENVTTPLMNFISHCIDYNVNTRYTAEEAANEYRKLLPIFKTHLKQDELRKGLAGLDILNEANDLPLILTPVKSSAKKNSPVKSNHKNNSVKPFSAKSNHKNNSVKKYSAKSNHKNNSSKKKTHGMVLRSKRKVKQFIN